MSFPALTRGEGGLPCLDVSGPGGSSLRVYTHGALITSFVTSAGQELLFVSTRAVYDGVAPIRGGIPIAFPQFASQGPLPMHGFARTQPWALLEAGVGHVSLGLHDTDATRAVWPHPFTLRLDARFTESALTVELT